MKNKVLVIVSVFTFCLLTGAYIIDCAPIGERVVIPIGSTIELSWQPSPDTDIASYDAYFVSLAGDTTKVGITEWNTVGDTTNLKQLAQILPLGDGFVKMTATDRAGSKSDFSPDSAAYTVVDLKPLPPSFIRIKVVGNQPVNGLKMKKAKKIR